MPNFSHTLPSDVTRQPWLRLRTVIGALVLSTGVLGAHGAMADTAIFAGGCFWCMESDFEKQSGVEKVVSGYTGGHVKNPTYNQVVTETTGHYEAVEVTYDPAKVSYQTLLSLFWHSVDPFDAYGQFCDKGSSYKAAIFIENPQQRAAAEQSLTAVEKTFPSQTVTTQILNAQTFYPAETYHQDFYKKNPVRYKFYRWNCGRDQRLEKVWGDKANKA